MQLKEKKREQTFKNTKVKDSVFSSLAGYRLISIQLNINYIIHVFDGFCVILVLPQHIVLF